LASSCVCGASSAFDIAVPPSPEPSVAFAAEELSSYVSRITGVRPEIVTNDAPKLGVSLKLDPSMDDDSFEFKARNGLFRVRGGVRGVLYGVYEMLERFGIDSVIFTKHGDLDYSVDFAEIGTYEQFHGIDEEETE
jgi:hypothetical protein